MVQPLLKEKVLNIQNMYPQFLAMPLTIIKELAKPLEKLSFTAQAVLLEKI